MKQMKKSTKITLFFLIAMIGLYWVQVVLLGLPPFSVPLTFLLVFALLGFVFRREVWAVRGNWYYSTGNTEKARTYLKKATQAHSKSPVAHLNYAIMLLRESSPNEAFALLERAKTLQPNTMTKKNIDLTMGSCFWVMGEIDKAILALEDMRKTYEYVNEHVLTTLAYMYILKKEYEMAKELTEKALVEAPESYAAWDNMGQIYFRQNQISEAKTAFLKALAAKETLVDSLFFMGLIAEQEGDAPLAKSYFQKASECSISALNTVKRQEIDEKLAAHTKQ